MAVMEIQCPHCRAKFHLPPDQAGKVVRCGACQELFTTPAVSAMPPAPPAAPKVAAPVQTARAVPTAPAAPRVRMKVADAEPVSPRDSRSSRRVDDDDDLPRPKSRKSKADEKPAFPLIPVLAGGGGLLVLLLVVLVVVLATRSGGSADVTKNTTAPTTSQPSPIPEPAKPAVSTTPTPAPVQTPQITASATTPATTTPPAKTEAPIGDAVAQVKNSTVYIRCHSGNMLGMGSGFFAGPDGYIVTNAHVIGYGPDRIRNPQKIEIVVNSGEPNQTVYKSRIVGVNVDDDLALLWINQQDNPRTLPRALTFGKSADLTETQEVLIFGFPLGEQLGLNISVNKSTVSSLRKENGVVAVVQVAGGMTNGNSGGPVTNTKGEVIGVSVAGIKGSQINFAIPCDTASRFVEKQIQAGGTFEMGKLAPQFRPLPKR